MPVRLLRPGITTSEKWNSLDWLCQSFYIRLITLVDDYGRYDANPQLLRSHAFPLHTDAISCKKVISMCEMLSKVGIALFYEDPIGKKYLQMTSWKEKPRSEPKYRSFDDSCKQLFANDIKCLPPTPTPSDSPSDSPSTTPMDEFWKEYPKKVKKDECLKIWNKINPSQEIVSQMLTTLSWQKNLEDWKKENGKFIPHPSTWLNKGRWKDEKIELEKSKSFSFLESENEA